MWVRFEIFKILYRLNYSDFYFVYYHCNVTTVLKLHSVSFCQAKLTLRCIFSVNFGRYFFHVNLYYKALVT